MERRCLEIGPSTDKRLEGFETLDIVEGPDVDHVCDASRNLPFQSDTFDLVYASHILEHIPWYMTEQALIEWVRVLKPGGVLEAWVPDGLKICETLLLAEREGVNLIDFDGWYKFNPRKDPCVWAAGRLYTYGDGTGSLDHPNWHRAIFTSRYLKESFEAAGLIHVREMDPSEARGTKHGWITLGVRGIKDELPKH